MNPFSYHRATSPQDAVEQIGQSKAGKFIGGGTNLIDLMKENIERPAGLIDVNALPFKSIKRNLQGALSIGALLSNAATAYHPEVEENYPLLAEAILAGASPQLRNMATNGGNLLQRTRCYYFYDRASKCNKRNPGAGCDAIGGYNRIHAVLGQSDSCIAVHPSDMCVALAALGASVQVAGPEGERSIAFKDFHLLPGDSPEKENSLLPGELVTSIELPAESFSKTYRYLKVRDRSSYAFALVSAAVALGIEAGLIREARVAMGGVAHKPWRDFQAEKSLLGKPATLASYQEFARQFFAGARGYEHNSFKIELGRSVLVRAMSEAAQRGVAQ